jgi:adenosylcobinamide-GDP ribazoletransferase
MRRLFAAISLLTIIPVPVRDINERDLECSKPFFPVVGLILGGIAYGVASLLVLKSPPAVSAMVLVIMLAAFSKGFHLDGLADSADGFMSSRSRERMMEIMRDSWIGSMGVFAIFAVLGLKAAAFMSLLHDFLPAAALMTALSGRCAIVIYIYISKYARPDGLGKVMFNRQSLITCLWALALMSVAGFLLLGWSGLLIPAVIVVFTVFWRWYTVRMIGGATGDTIGACEEISEMLVPLIICLFCIG